MASKKRLPLRSLVALAALMLALGGLVYKTWPTESNVSEAEYLLETIRTGQAPQDECCVQAINADMERGIPAKGRLYTE